MTSWLPTFKWLGHTMSDGDIPEEDAEGWMLEIEWRGHIVELCYLRRGHAHDPIQVEQFATGKELALAWAGDLGTDEREVLKLLRKRRHHGHDPVLLERLRFFGLIEYRDWRLGDALVLPDMPFLTAFGAGVAKEVAGGRA